MPDWNARYAGAPAAIAPPRDIVQRAAKLRPPGNALDLACGLGRNALYLAELGWHVTAVDASWVAIDRLSKVALSRRLPIDCVTADLESAEFSIAPGSYDLICDCYYLQRSLVPALRAGIRPGGIAALELPLVPPPANPAFLVQPGEIRSWFDDWDIVECSEDVTARLIARRRLD